MSSTRESTLPTVQPTIEIEVDLDRAQAFGITPGAVRRAEATLLQGIQVGSIFEEQKVFDVIVQGAPSTRGSVESVRRPVDRPAGRRPRDPGPGRRRPRRDSPAGHPTGRCVPPAGRRGRRQRPKRVRRRGTTSSGGWRRQIPAGVPRRGARRDDRRRDRGRSGPRIRDRGSWSRHSCCCRQRSGAGGSPRLLTVTFAQSWSAGWRWR